jgi:hypothetical protein
MEIMEELGLAEKLLQLPHTKARTLTLQTEQESVTVVDFQQLKTQFPYITLMPQARFLEFIQERIFTGALNLQQLQPPAFQHLPFLRNLIARLIAFGVFPVHLKPL